jgi:hypothetical protein
MAGETPDQVIVFLSCTRCTEPYTKEPPASEAFQRKSTIVCSICGGRFTSAVTEVANASAAPNVLAPRQHLHSSIIHRARTSTSRRSPSPLLHHLVTPFSASTVASRSLFFFSIISRLSRKCTPFLLHALCPLYKQPRSLVSTPLSSLSKTTNGTIASRTLSPFIIDSSLFFFSSMPKLQYIKAACLWPLLKRPEQ